MLVRLTAKLAEVVDGIDLSACREGDIVELSDPDAGLLIAEGWAERVEEPTESAEPRVWRPDARAVAAERRRRPRR